MPTPDEVYRLQLGPGTPVAIHVLTGFTDDSQPVRVAVNVLPSDRHVIVHEASTATAGPRGMSLTIRLAQPNDVDHAARLVTEAAKWLADRGSD